MQSEVLRSKITRKLSRLVGSAESIQNSKLSYSVITLRLLWLNTDCMTVRLHDCKTIKNSLVIFKQIVLPLRIKILTLVAMAEKTRYSDEELEEFRQIIMAKLEKARRDYEVLKASITHEDNNDTMDTSPTFKVLEEGATTLSKEEAGRLAQRQLKFIQHLQAALVRIENKTYGICRETWQLISKERLRAVPHATLCMEAKLKQK
jgi:DnaK suppressor protein